MSELDIQRRREYKQNRKKWTIIQLVAIVLLAVIALSSFLIYNRMARTYRIEYTESSKIDYNVQYSENNFFEEEWIGSDQTYISSLIKGMTADFVYRLNSESSDMAFNYKYEVNARLLVASKDSGTPYYQLEENIFASEELSSGNSSRVRVNEKVAIDYVKYNRIAKTFVDAYDLKNSASCTLIITLDVEVLASNKNFDKESQNKYSTALNIPLVVETFNVFTTSSSSDTEVKVLEYQDIANRDVFFVIFVSSLALSMLLVMWLFVFLHLTRNEDIAYSAKIRRILRSYSYYIQRIDGEFDCEGYQRILVKTFNEMLSIRDTIQAPILAFENKDETMTSFLIPTSTKLIYVFEIKVDNYDALYNNENDEGPKILEEIDEEELAEAMAQPDVILSNVEYNPDDDDQFEVTPEEPGVEVVGVVWPERPKHNKVYRYDPNGEKLDKGDIVLVPTYDAARGRDVIRKVAVAHENHRVEPDHIKHPLKKIVAVVKRNVASYLTPNANKSAKESEENQKNEELV